VIEKIASADRLALHRRHAALARRRARAARPT